MDEKRTKNSGAPHRTRNPLRGMLEGWLWAVVLVVGATQAGPFLANQLIDAIQRPRKEFAEKVERDIERLREENQRGLERLTHKNEATIEYAKRRMANDPAYRTYVYEQLQKLEQNQ